MVICLERGANDLHMVQLMPLPPHHLLLQQYLECFILLVPAYPGCPGKKAVKCLCVCATEQVKGSHSLKKCILVHSHTKDDCALLLCAIFYYLSHNNNYSAYSFHNVLN